VHLPPALEEDEALALPPDDALEPALGGPPVNGSQAMSVIAEADKSARQRMGNDTSGRSI
jgi:hypothetical protein